MVKAAKGERKGSDNGADFVPKVKKPDLARPIYC